MVFVEAVLPHVNQSGSVMVKCNIRGNCQIPQRRKLCLYAPLQKASNSVEHPEKPDLMARYGGL